MKLKLHSFWGAGVCIAVLLCVTSPSNSQSLSFGNPGVEVGLNLAPMNFLGDVGGNYGRGTTFLKDNNMEFVRLMKGAYVTVYPKSYLGVRLALNIGRLEGHDSVINGKGGLEEYRRERNLGFRSNLTEAYLAAEVYPTVLLEADPSDNYKKFRPYGVAGVGVFKFNPMGEYISPTGQRSWVELHKLRTEGQGFNEYPDRKEYKLTQINIPLGVGFKYFVSETFHVGFEIMHRITFTDYIDDVSTNYIDPNLFSQYLEPSLVPIAVQMSDRQNYFNTSSRPGFFRREGDMRGQPKNNDAYFSAGLKFGWSLGSRGNRGSLRQSRCPVW